MKTRARVLVSLLVASVVASSLWAQPSVAEERVAAAFLVALGRKPTAAETAEWAAKAEKATVGELVAEQAAELQRDPAKGQEVARKAYVDAFGAEASQPVATGGTYVELMKGHLARLQQDGGEFRAVLDRAYRRVVRRSVYDEEVAYWNEFGVMPYVLVVGAVDDWGRRNQPGLMVTAGTPTVSVNSVYLATARLSRKVAEEARAAVGLAGANTDYFHYGSSRTVIAPGAENLVAGGRIHFLVAGAAGVAAAQ
jgi:hypothetical protein